MAHRFISLDEVRRAEEIASSSLRKVQGEDSTWPAQTRFVAGLDGNPTPRRLMGENPVLYAAKGGRKKN